MNDEMKRALEEIERDFLEEEVQEDIPQDANIKTEEDEFEELLAKILAESDEPVSRYRDGEPAFEDPDKPDISDQPVVYRNYSNDYGNKRHNFAAYKENEMAKKRATRQAKKNDKWTMILMGIASLLCIGIIGVLVYWLEVYLK